MVLFCCLSELNFHEVRRVFKFFHKIDHFKPNFTLKITFFNGNNAQAGLVNHICLSFQYSYPNITGCRAAALRLVHIWHTDQGVGALQGPLFHGEILHLAEAVPRGGLWVSNCLLVWSILT